MIIHLSKAVGFADQRAAVLSLAPGKGFSASELPCDLACAEGTAENSPAFQRWERSGPGAKSRRDGGSPRSVFGRPFGTWRAKVLAPSVETLGYCQMSLRDTRHLNQCDLFRDLCPPKEGLGEGNSDLRKSRGAEFCNCLPKSEIRNRFKTRGNGKTRNCLAATAVLWTVVFSLRAQTLSEDALAQIRFEQKLNAQITLSLPFQDESGKPVQLDQYFGRKPVLLVLGYYECPMLCTLVLNGMVESAADMKWSIGKDFEVVDVSISPSEGPPLAAAKKRTYVKRYGRSGAAAGWHFLTGNETSIRRLADEVGFRYAYDPASKQYAHPSGLVVLTPEGKVSRYLFGVTYAPAELFAALRQASSNQVGSPIQQLILLCFHYNPITGKYSGTIIVILRLLGGATVLGLLGLVVALACRPRPSDSVKTRISSARLTPTGQNESAP